MSDALFSPVTVRQLLLLCKDLQHKEANQLGQVILPRGIGSRGNGAWPQSNLSFHDGDGFIYLKSHVTLAYTHLHSQEFSVRG